MVCMRPLRPAARRMMLVDYQSRTFDRMITPTPTDLNILAVAVGFLISGTFMRFVWKSRKDRDPKRSAPRL